VANTITAVLPSIYAGLRVVSREMIGLIPAVQRDANYSRVALNQVLNVPVVGPATSNNIVPGSIPPDDGDTAPTTIPLTISKSKYSPVRWSGEEQLAIGANGTTYNLVLAQQFAQAFRVLSNEIEADGVAAAVAAASRAYGTAGTAPFGTADDFTDFAGLNRILDQNGSPMFGRSLVVGSDARFNLEGKQKILFKVNEAGTDALLRDRSMANVSGFGIGYSAGVVARATGTGSGYLVNHASGYPVGATAITVDTGTGTYLNGDTITFAGDTNQYVVVSLTGTALVIAGPGLRQAVADNAAITKDAAYTPNLGFTQDALLLAARAPAEPDGGDAATDARMVTDPVSGLSFEIRHYKEYRRARWEVGVAWGWGAPNGQNIGLLKG